jgi:hypothetical protein
MRPEGILVDKAYIAYGQPDRGETLERMPENIGTMRAGARAAARAM